MYSCPNCAGALRFSIKSQDLFCEHCDSHFSPYDIEKEQDAEFNESGMYETSVFTCPGCGGEITSTDTQISGFCSYCGSPTILSARITKEPAPATIIPFSVTKEDCIKKYKRALRWGLFVPGEMVSSSHIDKFRCIYMPYWNFKVGQNNVLHLQSHHTNSVGDYVRHRIYRIDAALTAEYGGITYDAFSLFHDSISSEIAPFDTHDAKRFTPSYLLGFYSNQPDVPSALYMDQAEAEAKQDLYDFVASSDLFEDVPGVLDRSGIRDEVHPAVKEAKTILLPVWLLSFRYKNRIAYATVNGQTGKISADLPISPGKYLIFAVIISFIIFLCLLAFSTFKPLTLLFSILICSSITMILYHRELIMIHTELLLRDDVGYAYRLSRISGNSDEQSLEEAVELQKKKYAGRRLKHFFSEKKEEYRDRIQNRKGETSFPEAILNLVFLFGDFLLSKMFRGETVLDVVSGLGALYGLILGVTFLIGIFDYIWDFFSKAAKIPGAFVNATDYLYHYMIDNMDLRLMGIVFGAVTVLFMILIGIRERSIQKEIHEKLPHLPGVLFPGVSLLTALAVMILQPSGDLWYCLATVVTVATEVLSILQLIRFYNYLATRKLPQYNLYEGEE